MFGKKFGSDAHALQQLSSQLHRTYFLLCNERNINMEIYAIRREILTALAPTYSCNIAIGCYW